MLYRKIIKRIEKQLFRLKKKDINQPMKTNHILSILLVCLLSASAGNLKAHPLVADTLTLDLPLPTIPSTLRTPPERAAYLLAHFWDSMDFADTLHSRHPGFVEQNLVNYLSLFPHAQADAHTQAVHALMQRAEADKPAYLLLAELAEKYLHTSDSPMRDEEHFIPFLEEQVRTPLLDETEKSRPRFLLAAALKNRPGTTSTDFTYHTPAGRQQTLHGTPSASRLLLLFYNPDCQHCREVIARLQADRLLGEMLHDHRLTVLAINTEGDAGAGSSPLLPTGWTTGTTDPAFADKAPYLLPAMPTLYLLDGTTKQVLLKEALPEEIHAHLATRENPNNPETD